MSARRIRRDHQQAAARETRRIGRGTKLAVAAGAGIGATVLFAPVAQADTFTVTKLADTNDHVCDDDCSLREAVYEADFATGTTTRSASPRAFLARSRSTPSSGVRPSSLGLYGSVNVDGPGADVLSVSGDNQTAIFKIFGFLTPDRTTTISGLTLKEGDAVAGGTMGAGAINNYSVSSSLYWRQPGRCRLRDQ